MVVLRPVIIKASDVSAIMGENKFRPRDQVFNELWKKHSPETFNSKTVSDLVEESISKSVTVKNVIEEATLDTVKEAEKKILCDTSLTKKDQEILVTHVKSKVNTEFGIKNEERTAKMCGIPNLDTDETYYRKYLGRYDDNRDYILVGRIDRIETLPDGTKILIEIKNRTNKLYYKVYPREMIQIQMYLELLHLDKAKLVEQCGDEINIINITRDDDLIDESMDAVYEFCLELSRAMMEDEEDEEDED
jgi:hypothetical protein